MCKFIEGQDPAGIRNLIDENKRAVYIETIGNPQFNVPDIKAAADVCHTAGISVIVDNTSGMGGYLSQPNKQGADIVTASCTKWIGGHGTSMAGIVIDGGHFDCSASEKFPAFTEPAEACHGMRFWETYGYKVLAAKLRMDKMRDLGPCMSPFNAWLFLQGLESLPVPADRHVSNTLALAHWLEKHPNVAWVNYPGLKSHQDYERAQRVLPKGQGAVLMFGVAENNDEVRGGRQHSQVVLALGQCGRREDIDHPSMADNASADSRPEKIRAGVTLDMIRVSLGLEHINDLAHDFEQAFVAAALKGAKDAGVTSVVIHHLEIRSVIGGSPESN